MNKYLVTVRVKGQTVKTMVYADSAIHARLILEYQFGIGNVLGSPTQCPQANEQYSKASEVLNSIKPITPLNPQQARLDSLKKQQKLAATNLEAERNRQKVIKAQQQIRKATTQKPTA